jgi:glycosyltransferase involved in cell wall biosynthesis
MTLPITAVLTVRNEAGCLRACLDHLVRNGARMIVIDNESTDGTPHILDDFSDHILVRDTLPWKHEHALGEILARTAVLLAGVTSGWIIHQDADEILTSCDPDESLRGAIERIDATGANAINFDEFVFFPPEGESLAGRDYYALARHYYFFEPKKVRLMRAWRADAGLLQTDGGHRLSEAGRRLHPQNLDLRHYPFLSQEHARLKYSTRRFAAQDTARGWHHHRRNVQPEDMDFPAVNRLKLWEPGQALDRSDPWPLHFWVERKTARLARELGS